LAVLEAGVVGVLEFGWWDVPEVTVQPLLRGEFFATSNEQRGEGSAGPDEPLIE